VNFFANARPDSQTFNCRTRGAKSIQFENCRTSLDLAGFAIRPSGFGKRLLHSNCFFSLTSFDHSV